MKITVIGTGYVGLVAGVCFAETGHEVVCVDIDEEKIALLRRGVATIYEPGLAEMLASNLRAGRLSFTSSLAEGVRRAAVVFIAVGTPSGEDGSADLSHVLAVAAQIGRHLDGTTVVVDKSTVPVGTADRVLAILQANTAQEVDVVSNPEFLKEGAAIQDFMHPDRIVVGASTERAFKLMRKLYEPFVRTGAPIFEMDVHSAEMSKYVANAMLATKISFINEMARLCDAVGADINLVRKAVGADRRIGSAFLFPGVGYGGSCFPKDVRAIGRTGAEHGLEMHMMKAVDRVNEEQKHVLCAKIDAAFAGGLKGAQFAVWGLAFKPRTDDMREAPSLVIVDHLLRAGAGVAVYDPQAMEGARRHYFKDRVRYATTPYEALEGADAILLLTEWGEFRSPDFDEVKKRMRGRRIFDGRNIYARKEVEDQGFAYFGIGV